MDPYRDDREALAARADAAERRADLADQRATRAEARLRRVRRRLVLDSLLILWSLGCVGFSLLVLIFWAKALEGPIVVGVAVLFAGLLPAIVVGAMRRTSVDEILAFRADNGRLWFVEPGTSVYRFGARRRLGALPSARVTIEVAGAAVIVGVAEDAKRREVALRQLADRDAGELEALARPVVTQAVANGLAAGKTAEELAAYVRLAISGLGLDVYALTART